MAQGLVLPFPGRQGVSPTGVVVGRLEVNVSALTTYPAQPAPRKPVFMT